MITFVLLLIIGVFNLLMREYIKGNVNMQLRGVKTWAFQNGKLETELLFPPIHNPAMENNNDRPEIRMIPRSEFGRGEVLIVNQDYEMIFPDEARIFVRDYNDRVAITSQMKKNHINLDNEEIMRLKASGREYYFVSLKTDQEEIIEPNYLLYLIDMTSIANFSHRINIVLLSVLLLALLLSIGLAILLSVIITKPIKELTEFADRIGHGDFQPCPSNYKDLELSMLSESMNQAAVKLDQYNQEQKTFFQNVSHELRTPLQSIKSNAEAIVCKVIDQKKASQIIIEQTDRLTEMVDGLLYFSYLDTVNAKMETERCDLREILSNCAERQRTIAEDRNLAFDFIFEKKPVMINCDEKRIYRAFSNVLSNAIRYAHVKIWFTCQTQDKEAVVSIADDGDGMSPDELPCIFDRFYKGLRGNHGIGLSIVKTIVEQHHGSIEATSSEKGSVFTFRFPIG